MKVERLVLGALDTNCWIVSAHAGAPVVVIDPAGDWEQLRTALASREVAMVVLTHAHFDHLGAASELVAATHAPLAIHEKDADRITSPAAGGTGGATFGFDHTAPPADRILHDDELLEVADMRFRVLHTPGHTEGSICLFAEGAGHLFSGDTLFMGSVGRTDFVGGDAHAMSRSLNEKLAPLPNETMVHPGHGPDTMLAREKRMNPFFRHRL